ncbi:hypothetical protein NX059_006592 [Plenodomus lindquistii]|nr:hypothetical protein NX059_006592 [Plenodomus lindquistii]
MPAFDPGSWRNARYHCSICQRPFDRKDTLSRHMQVHGKQRPPSKSKRKACVSCSQSKIRCNGQRPTCSSCQRRNLTCVFEETGTSRSRGSHSVAPNSTRLNTIPDVDASSLNALLPEVPMVENWPMSPIDGTQPTDGDIHNDYSDGQGSGQNQSQRGLLSPSSITNTAPNSDFLLSCFDDMDFNFNLDWFMVENPSDDFLTGPGFKGPFTAPTLYNTQHPLMSAPQTAVADVSQAGDNTPPDEAQGSTTILDGLLTPLPQTTSDYGDLWPLENPRPPPNRVLLPALKSDSSEAGRYDRFNSIMPINDRTWHALQKCIGLPFEHTCLQTLDIECFPSKEQLDHCIDLYFTHFDPSLPVIHKPTFDPGRDLLVTLAVINIGACYTGFSARSFSAVLSDLLRRLLLFTAEQDRRFVRSASYVTAQLLQNIHGYCSGSQQLFELSEACRSSLVHNARCMGLFRFENSQPDHPPASLEETWRIWITAETLRRLGWAVYKYDASVSYLHNNRPFLTIGDINLRLPSSIEHWEALTPQAWASLHPWCKTVPSSPRLLPTVKMLFDGTPNPLERIVDEEHRFLVVLTLLRMLWSQKEIGIHDLVNLPSYDDGRKNILRAMDQMTSSITELSNTHTVLEIERIVHRVQLVHLAHIYGAGDLMNWLYPYLRNGPEVENARARMKQWADEDPQRTREVAYHCAQIIGLVRHYPNNMPMHGFIIFHAGVVLVCVSSVLPQISTATQGASLQLDDLAAETHFPSRQSLWVKNGGNEKVGLVGIPSLYCTEGRQRVLDQTVSLLRRQRSWGMARNLTKMALSLQDKRASVRQFSSQPASSSFTTED